MGENGDYSGAVAVERLRAEFDAHVETSDHRHHHIETTLNATLNTLLGVRDSVTRIEATGAERDKMAKWWRGVAATVLAGLLVVSLVAMFRVLTGK
jgi:hypothetical protein